MEHSVQTTPSSIVQQEEIIRQLDVIAKARQCGMAVWRLPNDNNTYAIIAENRTPFSIRQAFEELPFGFLFHPFSRKQDGIFLKADKVYRFSEGKPAADEAGMDRNNLDWLADTWKEVSRVPKPSAQKHPSSTISRNESSAAYIALVNRCLSTIESGQFEKVVPSRFKAVPLPDQFDISHSITRLSETYPNALISYVYTPEHGSWLGATPEILVSVENKSVFKTVALAGTQSYTPGVNLRQVAWTQKEIEEQALVSRYIINCFKKIRLREFEEHGPKTIIAGNLLHLKTDFSVDMKSTNFPQLGSVMLRLLHPTSAVCGMPMEAAYDFLVQEEGYDRSFYSGFLGPVNHHDNTHLFVHLRCMQIVGNEAWCYAGAGVTIDSIPEKEWEETDIKMNTLLTVIR
jgi:isochorismate synthase